VDELKQLMGKYGVISIRKTGPKTDDDSLWGAGQYQTTQTSREKNAHPARRDF